jgi:prepilin-type N-terminal cleavage/methylation domain-containing protein
MIRSNRSAFTLQELLVVTAIVAVIMALVLPSLSAVRKQSRSVVCGTQLRELGRATTTYGIQFNDWLPGAPGTTGLPLLVWQESPHTLNAPTEATQTWDWAAPIAVYGLGQNDLPHDRARRFKRLREDLFQCPSNPFLSRVHPNSALNHGWPAVMPSTSYASIREFLYFGKSGNTFEGVNLPFWWNIRTPRRYRPRTTTLQRPADKVWLAEGAPYWPTGEGHDSPIGYRAGYGGAYATAGPCSSFSRAYPNNLARNDPATDARQPLQRDGYAYRHVTGKNVWTMQTLRFDGHVARMTRRDAILSVDKWYPSGSLLKASEFENGPYPKPQALESVMNRPLQSKVFFPVY